MKNKYGRPLEDEFRSSQVYRTLSGSGSYVADKIAEGLGKAAEGIDSALGGRNAPSRRGAPPAGNYYPPNPGPNPRGSGPMPGGPYPGQPQAGPRGGNGQYAARPNPGPDGYYHYRGTPQQPVRPPQQTRQAAPPPPPPPGYRPPRQQAAPRPAGVNPAPAPQMKLVRRPSVAKYYITGVTALLYALMLPMNEPAHFAVFAIVEVLIFLLSGLVFKGKKEFVPAEAEKPKEKPKEEPKKEEEKPSRTGNPEVDKIIDEGNGYLKKLRAANDAIPDEALSDCIDRMERASSDIFKFIAENPAKAPQIRKFMNYYLPTTLKLLGSYQRLASQSVKGETITSTMFNIAGMMHTVADAFEKQLDSLFGDEAMDISADITVFETLLKQEGFVEDQKEEG